MDQNPKVLLSSDSLSSDLLWNFRLQAKNLTIVMEQNMPRVPERALSENLDLLLLDLDLLDDELLQMIRMLREQLACPLIVLLSSWDAGSTLMLYDAGVDDCIMKPIQVELFIAKVNAWLRRRMVMPVEMLNPLRVGRTFLNPPEKVLTIGLEKAIRLTNIEVRVLYVLMSRAGHTVQTDELINLVWRNKEDVCRAILKNSIYRLRQKFETEITNLECIHTVNGLGYKFEPVEILSQLVERPVDMAESV
jgi:DNA-binding response OmpR family regulator